MCMVVVRVRINKCLSVCLEGIQGTRKANKIKFTHLVWVIEKRKCLPLAKP